MSSRRAKKPGRDRFHDDVSLTDEVWSKVLERSVPWIMRALDDVSLTDVSRPQSTYFVVQTLGGMQGGGLFEKPKLLPTHKKGPAFGLYSPDVTYRIVT